MQDKAEFLFWVFIYESCVGFTKLPYILYKGIIKNWFEPFAIDYLAKREFFKCWDKSWVSYSRGNIKRKFKDWKFGDNKSESDYCFELVKNGVKTATSYSYDEKTFVAPQQYSILLNWDGTEKVKLITDKYYITPFKEVKESHVYREGEGSCTLDEWRVVRKEIFTNELNKKGKKFTENTLIVCEEFTRY